jgi:hypothetical protein
MTYCSINKMDKIIKLFFGSRLQLLCTRLKFFMFIVKLSTGNCMLLCCGFRLLLVESLVLYVSSCYFGDVLTQV